MIKRGFTLAEALVSLGIIAIISALVIPSLMNNRPDSTKLLLIKKYNELYENTEQLLSDMTIYNTNTILDNNNGNTTINIGLRATDTPTSPQFNSCSDADTKYMCCLAVLYGAKMSNNYFTTSDGTKYTYYLEENSGSQANGTNGSMEIIIDSDRSGGNCAYGDNNCDKPNIFTFDINNAGMISPNEEDYLAQAYLQDINRTKSHNEYMSNAKALKSKADEEAKAKAAEEAKKNQS